MYDSDSISTKQSQYMSDLNEDIVTLLKKMSTSLKTISDLNKTLAESVTNITAKISHTADVLMQEVDDSIRQFAPLPSHHRSITSPIVARERELTHNHSRHQSEFERPIQHSASSNSLQSQSLINRAGKILSEDWDIQKYLMKQKTYNRHSTFSDASKRYLSLLENSSLPVTEKRKQVAELSKRIQQNLRESEDFLERKELTKLQETIGRIQTLLFAKQVQMRGERARRGV